MLCKISNIDRCNYYHWQKKYNPLKNNEFYQTLSEVFIWSDKTFGYRRMHLVMKSLGFKQNEKKVRYAMNLLNLHCEIRQKKRNYKKVEITNKCKNYLNQNFHPTKPNSHYSVDITYLQTKKGIVYLNVIIDLFGKIPVAYLSSYNCDSKLAEDTIDILVKKRKNIKNVIIHSDQGSSYLSKSYIKKLSKLKVIRSNSKKGYPFDNACSENFFSIFKTEKFYSLGYQPKDKEEIDEIVEDYIDFYINKRISTTLNGLTPQKYYDNYIQNKKYIN